MSVWQICKRKSHALMPLENDQELYYLHWQTTMKFKNELSVTRHCMRMLRLAD